MLAEKQPLARAACNRASCRVDFSVAASLHPSTAKTRPLPGLALTNTASALCDHTTRYADTKLPPGIPALPRGNGGSMGALGLVVNALVLWNTRYLQQALAQWQEMEEHLNPKGVARLSPLWHEHVNMLGRYDFTLPEAVAAARVPCAPPPLGSIA